MFAEIAFSVAVLLGPRLLKVVADALPEGVVAEGRDWK